MDRDFLSEFLDLNGDGHVTPEEARIGLSFLETALHREPELWDEDGFDENAADDDGEYGFGGYLLDDDDGSFEGFDEEDDDAPDDGGDADNTFIEDFDGFDSFDEDDGFDDEIDRVKNKLSEVEEQIEEARCRCEEN